MLKIPMPNIISFAQTLLTLGFSLSACSTIPATETSQDIVVSEMECTRENILNNRKFEKKVFAYIFNDRFSFIALECGTEPIFFNEEKSDPRSLQLLRDAVNNEYMGFSGEIIIRPDSPPISQFGNIWVTIEVVGPLIIESPEENDKKAKKRLGLE